MGSARLLDAVLVQEPDVAELFDDIGRQGLGRGEAPYAGPRLRSQAHARGGDCGKHVGHSVRASVTMPVCDVTSGCVKVRDTLNEIEEVDFTHGTENDSHAG